MIGHHLHDGAPSASRVDARVARMATVAPRSGGNQEQA